MRFWDASAIVPLLQEEPTTATCRELLTEDADVVVWWGTAIECASAVSRLERTAVVGPDGAEAMLSRLHDLRERWMEIQPLAVVRTTALRLLRLHPLRSADSLQLAAAITCAEGEPRVLPFVCLDRRLADAARREGFSVLEPG